MLARAHQRELDLVLDVLDVEGAALRLAAHQRVDHRRRSGRATSSRMRAEAAPWAPFTARNALVIATEILPGSNPTTAPLRRMTLYSAYGPRGRRDLTQEGLTPEDEVAVALS